MCLRHTFFFLWPKTMLPMVMMKNHIKSHFDDDVSLVRLKFKVALVQSIL